MGTALRPFVAISLCMTLLTVSIRAHAEDPQPANPTPAPAADTPPAPAPAPAPSDPAKPAPSVDKRSFDFDLLDDNKKPPGVDLTGPTTAQRRDPAVIDKQVRTRRRTLQLHQGFGFATLILLAATCVVGQLNYQDKYGGGDFTEKYQTPHLALALTSTASFATTGLLAMFAPTPYKKPIKADAALAHKILMGIATAGMAAQLALGFATAAKGGELLQRDSALTHLVTGYVTFASMSAGYLAFVF